MLKKDPKVTREDLTELCAPKCPHCHERSMAGATVTLEQIVTAWPIRPTVTVEADGYAPSKTEFGLLVFSCPGCCKPSALAIDDDEVKLVAMRTEKDERLLKETV
jgi:hypothetical protein